MGCAGRGVDVRGAFEITDCWCAAALVGATGVAGCAAALVGATGVAGCAAAAGAGFEVGAADAVGCAGALGAL